MIFLEAKNYRTHKHLELEIPENQLTTFVGANGSGKSSGIQALVHPIFGECYYIEGGKKARPNELIRHGENGLYAAVTFPTFKAEVEYKNGSLTRTVYINGTKVDSDRNDQHQAELMKHIGANRFIDLPAAIKRFCYISPSSKNIYTIGDAERKAYLLERWDFSQLQEIYRKAQKKYNSNGDQIKALEQHQVDGVETDTRFLKEDIVVLEKLVSGKAHYNQIEAWSKRVGIDRTQLERMLAESLVLEDQFAQEQVPLMNNIYRLQAESRGDLIERKLCEEQTRDLDLKFKLVNNEIDQIRREIANPLKCKKCEQEHFYKNGDIFLFDRNQIEIHLLSLKDEAHAKASEYDHYNDDRIKWLLRDDLAKAQQKLEDLKANQQIRRENNEKEIVRLRAEIEVAKEKIIEAQTYEKEYRKLEALKDQLKIAEAENLIIVQEKKRRQQTLTLRSNNHWLEFLTKDGIPNIVHEAIDQPLINLMAEINKSLEALDLDIEAKYRLPRNGDNLPSGIDLYFLVNGREETYTTINSQGLQACIDYCSLIAEFQAFGTPFDNLCGLTLFDDPLLALGDMDKLDLKSRLARAIGATDYGTRIVAVPDENAVMKMRPHTVYRFEMENGETKVSKL